MHNKLLYIIILLYWIFCICNAKLSIESTHTQAPLPSIKCGCSEYRCEIVKMECSGDNSRQDNDMNTRHHNITCDAKCAPIETRCEYGCAKNKKNKACQCLTLDLNNLHLVLIDPITKKVLLDKGRWRGNHGNNRIPSSHPPPYNTSPEDEDDDDEYEEDPEPIPYSAPSPHTQPPPPPTSPISPSYIQPTPINMPAPIPPPPEIHPEPINDETPSNEEDTAPTEEPIMVPVEEPISVPVEEPISVPVEEPISVPVEEPISVPVEEPISVPVEEPMQIVLPSPTINNNLGFVHQFEPVILSCGDDTKVHPLEFEFGQDDHISARCIIERDFRIEKGINVSDTTGDATFASVGEFGVLLIEAPAKIHCIKIQPLITFDIFATALCTLGTLDEACLADNECILDHKRLINIQVPVIWNGDETPPVISGVVTGEFDIEYIDMLKLNHTIIEDSNITAIDKCTGEVNVLMTQLISNRDEKCPEYTFDLQYKFKATDYCNNTAQIVQLYHVGDRTAPSIINGPDNLSKVATCNIDTGNIDLPDLPANIQAVDNSDTNPTLVFNERKINGKCSSEYSIERKWTATDNCGNSKDLIQLINVKDEGAPLLGTTIDICVWPPITNKIIAINNIAEILSRLIKKEICDNEPNFALIPNGYCALKIGGETSPLEKPPCFIDGEIIYALPAIVPEPKKQHKTDDPIVTISPRIYSVDYILKDKCGNERTLQFNLIIPHEESEDAINICTEIINHDHITLGTTDSLPQPKGSSSSIQKKGKNKLMDFLDIEISTEKLIKYAEVNDLEPENARLLTKSLWENDERIKITLTRDKIARHIDQLNKDLLDEISSTVRSIYTNNIILVFFIVFLFLSI